MGTEHQQTDKGAATMSVTEDSVQIARLEERMRSMDADMKAQTEALALLREQMEQVLDKLNEAKGGWRMLMWLGGGAATLGAAVSWAASHITVKF